MLSKVSDTRLDRLIESFLCQESPTSVELQIVFSTYILSIFEFDT